MATALPTITVETAKGTDNFLKTMYIFATNNHILYYFVLVAIPPFLFYF